MKRLVRCYGCKRIIRNGYDDGNVEYVIVDNHYFCVSCNDKKVWKELLSVG